MERKQHNWFKRNTLILIIVVLVIIVGLATGAVLLATSKHNSNNKTQAASPATTAPATTTSQYKLAACTSGATQTIANASYLVGTDIAPGSYKVVSQPAGTDWTNINIYSSKADYDKQGDPSNEQGNPAQSLSPQNGVVTYTKLIDGQYMVLDADPATFTCE